MSANGVACLRRYERKRDRQLCLEGKEEQASKRKSCPEAETKLALALFFSSWHTTSPALHLYEMNHKRAGGFIKGQGIGRACWKEKKRITQKKARWMRF